jgi:hypothetical protein
MNCMNHKTCGNAALKGKNWCASCEPEEKFVLRQRLDDGHVQFKQAPQNKAGRGAPRKADPPNKPKKS